MPGRDAVGDMTYPNFATSGRILLRLARRNTLEEAQERMRMKQESLSPTSIASWSVMADAGGIGTGHVS